MQGTALYQYLPGLQSPWTVSRVNLDVIGQRAARVGLDLVLCVNSRFRLDGLPLVIG